ncbi:MAG TPA: DUF6049 family protein [Actinospica sp.]|nr:DUF6049 family protein [Actinospica sp.]
MTRLLPPQRTLRTLLALSLVASAGLLGLAAAPAASASEGVAVSLTTMTPAVATSSSQQLSLAGDVTVPSGSSHTDVIVQLGYEAVGYRSQMGDGPQDSDQELYSVQDRLGTLSSGSHAWSLQTPISALGLSAGTVYALDVRAYSGGNEIGSMRTYLPYKIGSGGSTVAPTHLTVLAPVTATSPADGYQETQGNATYSELTSDTLVSDMATGGSLYKLLSAGAQLPKGTVSWVVDPDLLNTAIQIANGYVVASGGTATDDVGPDANNAVGWLKEAKTVLGSTNGELWQLPATDPDLGSLSNAAAAQAQQFLKDAAQQSTSDGTVKTVVDRDAQGLLAWPADGQVSAATLSLADSINPSAVVVDSTSIGLSVENQKYTPTGRASADDRSNLVVGDTGLDAIMSGDSADKTYVKAGSNSSLLAGQRLLAQTALIAEEEPNLSRSIMLTLPRDAATSAADMGTLKVLQSASWITSSGLSSLLKQSADANASTGTPARSSAVAGTDLTSSQLSSALDLQSQLKLYQSILTKSDTTTAGFADAVLRTVSTGWRGNSKGWQTFESAVSSRLSSQTGLVYLIPKSDLTLSGTSGSIPFTVVNHLGQDVRLGLTVVTSPSGLNITQIPVRTFPAGGSTTVEVKVNTKVASSTYQVRAFLVTADGAHYGTANSGGSQYLQVTVTSIGFVALLLFAGSAALLIFAVGLRIYRGRRGSRTEPATREGD